MDTGNKPNLTYKLIFVYNADTGIFNKITDSAHKLLSPGTYKCNLCALTHSAIGGMKNPWREFLTTLHVSLEFLHRDEYENKNMSAANAPAVFIQNQNSSTTELLISSDEINTCTNINRLQSLLQQKLSTYLQKPAQPV